MTRPMHPSHGRPAGTTILNPAAQWRRATRNSRQGRTDSDAIRRRSLLGDSERHRANSNLKGPAEHRPTGVAPARADPEAPSTRPDTRRARRRRAQ